MAVFERFLSGIDKLTEWAAKGVIWLMLVLIATVIYEVVSRYVFNAPTIWHFEISRMLTGTIFLLTSAYVMTRRSHIRVDILYSHFSPRGQAIADVVLTLILVFPLWAVSLYYFTDWAAEAWAIKERSSDSTWRVITYPFKTVAPVGIFLMVLAILVAFIRDIKTIIRGQR